MDEDIRELQESTYWVDLMIGIMPMQCAFYRQLKLRPLDDVVQYGACINNAFHDLPLRFPRKDLQFDFFGLPHPVFTRFVGLLASLTLIHFGNTSKLMFYHCLDLRGLEFRSVDLRKVQACSDVWVAGFEGMRSGFIQSEKWAAYQTSFVSLSISMNVFLQAPAYLNFTKKYRNLWVVLCDAIFEEHMVNFAEAIFHPAIENVQAVLKNNDEENHVKTSTEKMLAFFDYCNNVKNFVFLFTEESMRTNLPFSSMKPKIEAWASRARRLQIFFFGYKNIVFQLHDKRLRRVVKHNDRYYWSDRTDIDNDQYQVFDHVGNMDYYKKLPQFYTKKYYKDILETIADTKKLFPHIS